MHRGVSLLVGANSGGVGKTTVMCALLNFLPDDVALQAVESRAVLSRAARTPPGEACYVAHEISPATYYYAYIWGRDAQTFFRLAADGHLIASNLHADTLNETCAQLCDENDVDPAHLAAVPLTIYLGTERSGWAMRRWVHRVYEHDGGADRLLWKGRRPGEFVQHAESALVSPKEVARYTHVVGHLQEQGLRRLVDVRRALVR